ncbi:carbon-nitrogen hydrolase [Mesobacillus boroniphilus JCM 21738]|uniref:Carbon-nitrogen hydrolase n=1 Tax=Mesobacillus boroniphilus JCM 21738 TaxID=1294265 RepID=W4RL96_9BACI|nr:carbon-nitrogen hydrolase [Mesobacillus boroniphilus JCM 21738]
MSELDLSKFEKRMIIRNTKQEDIDEIIKMQNSCFPGMEPWKRDQLESHLEIFPEANLSPNMMGK